jgi:predicted TPR repeat methyltransferase
MSGGLEFDEVTSRKVESVYLTPDVVAQRCEVLENLELREGERILDVGCGPGLLAYDMAASVGSRGRVCGIDLSEAMLAMARKRCAEQSWTEFRKADATGGSAQREVILLVLFGQKMTGHRFDEPEERTLVSASVWRKGDTRQLSFDVQI